MKTNEGGPVASRSKVYCHKHCTPRSRSGHVMILSTLQTRRARRMFACPEPARIHFTHEITETPCAQSRRPPRRRRSRPDSFAFRADFRRCLSENITQNTDTNTTYGSYGRPEKERCSRRTLLTYDAWRRCGRRVVVVLGWRFRVQRTAWSFGR